MVAVPAEKTHAVAVPILAAVVLVDPILAVPAVPNFVVPAVPKLAVVVYPILLVFVAPNSWILSNNYV
jgi:hypothetical protein